MTSELPHFHGTTVLSVRRNGHVAMGADGQVTLGETIVKHNAVKIRRLAEGSVLVGFAGAAADALSLVERFEEFLNKYGRNTLRAATELAKQLGIKVYTIGLGTNGTAMFPVAKDLNGKLIFRNAPVEIDEELLEYIAEQTEGQYFRATGNKKLEAIYDQIDKLEKTEIEELKYYNYKERYRPLVFLAGFLVLMEMTLRFTVFRSFI